MKGAMPALRLFGIACLLGLLQVTLVPWIFGAARPELVLALAAYIGLHRRPLEALPAAWCAGLVLDAFSIAPLGLHALAASLAACTAHWATARLDRSALPVRMLAAACGTAAALVLTAVGHHLLGAGGPLAWTAVHTGLAAAWTAAAAPLLFAWLEPRRQDLGLRRIRDLTA